jgi:hypothetical protein
MSVPSSSSHVPATRSLVAAGQGEVGEVEEVMAAGGIGFRLRCPRV